MEKTDESHEPAAPQPGVRLRLWHILLWQALAAIGFWPDRWWKTDPVWQFLLVGFGATGMTVAVAGLSNWRALRSAVGLPIAIQLLPAVFAGYDYFSRKVVDPFLMYLATVEGKDETTLQTAMVAALQLDKELRALVPAVLCTWGVFRSPSIVWRVVFVAYGFYSMIWYRPLAEWLVRHSEYLLDYMTVTSNCLNALCLLALIVAVIGDVRSGLDRTWLYWTGVVCFFLMLATYLYYNL